MQLETLFTEMADALRTKEETTSKISAESFPQRIKDLKVLDTTDATATANDVVAGKIAYANGNRVIGSVIDNGRLEYTPSNEEQIIPAGKTSGGVVKAVDLTPFTSDATATAGDIAKDKTAYVNGEKIIGNMPPTFEISLTEPTENKPKVWVQMSRNFANISAFDIYAGTGLKFGQQVYNLLPQKTYTLSFLKTRIAGVAIGNGAIFGWARIRYYNGSTLLKEEINSTPINGFRDGSVKIKKTFTTPENCNQITIYFDNCNGDNNINTKVSDVMVNNGDVAYEYEPYSATVQTYVKDENGEYIVIDKNTNF